MTLSEKLNKILIQGGSWKTILGGPRRLPGGEHLPGTVTAAVKTKGRFFCLPERSRGSQRPEKEPVALSQ